MFTTLWGQLNALAWSLIHFTWQGAAIALVLALVLASMRRSTPESRYLAACGALASLGLAPGVTFVSQAWARVAPDPASTPSAVAGLAPPLGWLLLTWCLGVSCMALRLGLGWLRLRRLIRRDTRPLDPGWAQRVEELAGKVGLRGPVRVVVSARALIPAVVGWWRPVVVLPVSTLTGLPAAYVESILLHELMHLRRFDPWVNAVQAIIESVFFFHPAVWWISRVVRHEREHCCDDAVIALTRNPLAYARALTELEGLRAALPALSTTAHDGGSLMSRIRRIVDNASPVSTRAYRSAPWICAASLLAFAIILAIPVIAGSAGALGIPWLPEDVERWDDLFLESARRHGLNPELLAIVTLVESGGNPDAVSTGGAMGLMQVMPATGRKIATTRGIDEFAPEQLRDPATNVDFGAWYLARQLHAFGTGVDARSVELAAAAYNGGPGQLRAHLDAGAALSDETANYKDMVRELWVERDASHSPAFERWKERYGSRLLTATREP